MDALKNIRHKIIKWLSFGDLLIINAELRTDGSWQTKEAGGIVIINSELRGIKGTYDYALYIDKKGQGKGALLSLCNLGGQAVYIQASRFIGAGR